MEEPHAAVAAVLRSLIAEVHDQLKLAGAVSHPGESGRAREEVIRRFLKRFVPTGFAIDTGFVIDSLGGISRQIDVVIYRPGYHPVFEIGGVKHFMVESIAAVVENKASIGSRESLRLALDNIKSVKSLDRTAGGENYRLVAGQKSASVDPDDFNDQVFGVIMTESSLATPTFMDEMLLFLRNNPRRVWPNMYVDVRSFVALYLSAPPRRLLPRPNDAQELALTNVAISQCQPPLMDLMMSLSDFLRVAEFIDFPPHRYFAFSRAADPVVPIDPNAAEPTDLGPTGSIPPLE